MLYIQYMSAYYGPGHLISLPKNPITPDLITQLLSYLSKQNSNKQNSEFQEKKTLKFCIKQYDYSSAYTVERGDENP